MVGDLVNNGEQWDDMGYYPLVNIHSYGLYMVYPLMVQ